MKIQLRPLLITLISCVSLLVLLGNSYIFGNDFPNLVDRTMEGVVFIEAGGTVDPATGQQGTAVGTGFFSDDSGMITTNAHVIEGMQKADQLRIRTKKSTKWYQATVVGADVLADVAQLRVDDWQKFRKEVPYKILRFAPASDLKVGDEVWAIGMPVELTWTMTHGYLSASYRKIEPLSPVYYMQSDLRITNGNSGGPLFNMAGQVVGINNMIKVVQGGSIPFAIPSEIVEKVIRDLHQDTKKIVWPRLGVSYTPSPEGVGMLIKEILPDSVLKGKAKVGDRILEVSTKFTNSPFPLVEEDDLPNHIFVLDTGDRVTLKVLSQENKISTVNVAVGAGNTSSKIIQAIEVEHQPQAKEKE